MLRSQRGHPQVVNPGFSDLEPKNGSQGRALARPGPHFAKTGAHTTQSPHRLTLDTWVALVSTQIPEYCTLPVHHIPLAA
jgi:hypothetical protein